MYNLQPLNLPTSIEFIYVYTTYLSILVFTSRLSLHIHTAPQFHVELRKPGSRWICFGVRVRTTLGYETVNLKLRKSAPYDHNARPSQTDGLTNIMAIARRFVLTNASRAKTTLLLRIPWHSNNADCNVPAWYTDICMYPISIHNCTLFIFVHVASNDMHVTDI